MTVRAEDLKNLNDILSELENDLFFEYYKRLRLFYEYLAHTYQTVDPTTGEIVPIKTDETYFDKMTK